MNRTQKTLFPVWIAALSLLFSFGLPSSKLPKTSTPDHIRCDEGTTGPVLKIKTRNTSGQLISATVELTQGTDYVQHLSGGEWITQAFDNGVHQIDISKAGYVTINTSFDAQGEEMTLEYTLIEE